MLQAAKERRHSQLEPKFTIQWVPNPTGEKLPSASTCFNILKLPDYKSKKTLKEKILYSIRSNSGFGLTRVFIRER